MPHVWNISRKTKSSPPRPCASKHCGSELKDNQRELPTIPFNSLSLKWKSGRRQQARACGRGVSYLWGKGRCSDRHHPCKSIDRRPHASQFPDIPASDSRTTEYNADRSSL
ncbi:unnamed protein product [Ectocarpus sp. 4 AP-2014]